VTRYAKQPRGSSICGPIAILNALKWAGAQATLRKDLKEIIKKTGCNRGEYGTMLTAFEVALRHFGKEWFRVTVKYPWPGIETLETFLRNPEHAVITVFRWRDKKSLTSGEHYAFITGVSKTGRTFFSVNYGDNYQTVAHVRREEILEDHRISKDEWGGIFPHLWFLEKIKRPNPP